jgi:hypothetical protein
MIMLTPMAQMTCSSRKICPLKLGSPSGAKLIAVDTTTISMNTSHRPRVIRNHASSRGVLRAAMSPALVPARNTNTGAQKCVIQRVKYSGTETLGSCTGSCVEPVMKKSRTWSSAMMMITRPRNMSMEPRRYERWSARWSAAAFISLPSHSVARA